MPVTRESGSYVLVIELPVELSTIGGYRLAAGRYAYCGSARGPGGLAARLARHHRRGKKIHWHVDQLTEVGTIVETHPVPGGQECDLLDCLTGQPGVSVPVPGFGSSDCRRCPAHLVRLPADQLDAVTRALAQSGVEMFSGQSGLKS